MRGSCCNTSWIDAFRMVRYGYHVLCNFGGQVNKVMMNVVGHGCLLNEPTCIKGM